MSELRTCPQCQTRFEPKRFNQRFCSPPCKWTFTNRNRELKPNVHGVCVVCSTSFSRYVEPSKIAQGLATAEYCGRRCKGIALSGEKHPMWRGGRIIEADGYVMLHVPDHPYANNKGYVFEHRLVMEKEIGRHLLPEEVVHHINDVTGDNRPENLRLYANNAEHKRDEEANRVRNAAGEFLTKGAAA